MTPGQKITLQPPLALVLAQHRIQDASGGREELIVGDFPRVPLAVGNFKNGAQQIGERLVRPEDAKVALILIQESDVAEKLAQHERVLPVNGARRRDVHRVLMEVRHAQVAQQRSAVGMWIGSHAPFALRCKVRQFRHKTAILIEQFPGLVALHPALKLLHMIGMVGVDQQRNLVCPESTLDFQAVDDLRTRPTLGRPENDHRPARPGGVVIPARVLLDAANVFDSLVDRGGHQLMHGRGIVAFHETWFPTAAAKELLQFLMLDPREHSRIADLETIEVEDRQHGAVRDGVQKFVGLPRGRERACLRFAVAHHAGDDQTGIVERGPESVAERVTQFAAFVNRPRRGWRNVAGDSTRERELREQFLNSGFVLSNIRINLAPCALKVNVSNDCRPAVSRAGDVKHVQIVFFDRAIQMDVDEVLPWCRAPVTDHERLHMRQSERFLQQGVVVQIDLTDGQVIRGAPVAIDLVQHCGVQRVAEVARGQTGFVAGSAGDNGRHVCVVLDIDLDHDSGSCDAIDEKHARLQRRPDVKCSDSARIATCAATMNGQMTTDGQRTRAA